MSTLAIGGSEPAASGGRLVSTLRIADLVLLALALPMFAAADLPMLGFAVCAAAWLAARGIGVAAERRARRVIAAGDRRAALGTIATATLGRVWLVALAILLVGLAERESGLAAAVLAAALVTAYLLGLFAARVLGPEESA